MEALTATSPSHLDPFLWGGPPDRPLMTPPQQVTVSANQVQDADETTPLLSSTSDGISPPRPNRRFGNFLLALSPVDLLQWRQMSRWRKSWQIVQCPMVLIWKLTIPVVDMEKEPMNNWNRPLACIQCITSPLFFVLAIGAGVKTVGAGVQVWHLTLLLGIVLSACVGLTSKDESPPYYHTVFAFFGFGVSVVWIYVVANEIVGLLKAIGIVLHVSDSILGLTALAWGNSLGDLIANITIARQGYPRMGISACFGGPLFNLLLGIGIPFSIVTFNADGRELKVMFNTSIVILTTFLSASLISSLVIIPLMKFEAKRIYGLYLLFLYFTFLILSICHEVRLF